MAQADVSCKDKVDLVDQDMIDRHAEELDLLRNFQDGLVKRARDIAEKA